MRWVQPVCATWLAWLVGLVGASFGQSTPPPLPESTLAGVYTGSQAVRGEESYMNICVGCHAAGTYVGQQFLDKWGGRPLSDFYEVMSEKMPKDDPGSLEPGEYAQILAYLLRQNKMPTGKAELPGDWEALRKIKLDVPKTIADTSKGTTRWHE